MYMVTMAARISHSVLESDASNASAAPWKLVMTLGGRLICASAALIAATASPRDAPLARLKDTVAAGNWPMWFTTSGMVRSEMVATVESGTRVPDADTM